MKFTKNTSEEQNYGSTMSDLIMKLIVDRDRFQQALRNTEDRLEKDLEDALSEKKKLEAEYDKVLDKFYNRKDFIIEIFDKLDEIVDYNPYMNRTKTKRIQ